jgi:phosphatidate cytidylyltransferase
LKLSRNLLIRAGSSLILGPLAIWVLYQGGTPFLLLACVMLLIGAMELLFMVTAQQFRPSIAVCVLMAFALFYSFYNEIFTLWIIAGIAGAILVFVLEDDRQDAMMMIMMTLFMAHVAAFAVSIREHDDGQLFWLLLVTVTWSMDIMSYVGGMSYGKTPLAPRISPKKTVEGAVTGIVSAVVISLFLLYLIDADMIKSLTLAMILLGPFAALCGDLLESVIKRKYGVKDSAVRGFNIIPGHGGLLDRVDGLVAVVALFYFVIALAG